MSFVDRQALRIKTLGTESRGDTVRTTVPTYEDLEACIRKATPLLIVKMKSGSLKMQTFQDMEKGGRFQGIMVKHPWINYGEHRDVESAYPFAPYMKGLLLRDTGGWYTCYKHPLSRPGKLWGVMQIWRWHAGTLFNLLPYQLIPRIECLTR